MATAKRLQLIGLGLVASSCVVSAHAQTALSDCKTSIMGALSGQAPMPDPMPMLGLKPSEPMPTGMAKDTATQGDVGRMAAVQDKCLDEVLTKDQSGMDKKN